MVSYELGTKRKERDSAFVSVGGGGDSPGFLGMSHAPFVVDNRGNIRNANLAGVSEDRLRQRLNMLATVEDRLCFGSWRHG
ncbi:MAG: hypothetical protein R3C01_08335 [Planctomycetaceae bacterium]